MKSRLRPDLPGAMATEPFSAPTTTLAAAGPLTMRAGDIPGRVAAGRVKGRRGPVVVGVAPGLGGGLAGVTLDGTVVAAAVMPVSKGADRGVAELDVLALLNFLRSIEAGHELRLVVVERVAATMKTKGAGSFAAVRSYGEILGLVKALGLRLELPTPAAWRKVVLIGTARDGQAAISYARRRFPGGWLLATAGSTRSHAGIAAALCPAEWGGA